MREETSRHLSNLSGTQLAILKKRLEERLSAQGGLRAPTGAAEPGALPRADRRRNLPLSFAQQRLWFLDQLAPGNSSYNMPAAFRLRGPLDTRALEDALREVIRRHEILRTTFAVAEGEPVQVIEPRVTFTLPVVDLRQATAPEAEVMRLARAEARLPFDLSVGPLLRVTLLKPGDEEHVLLLTMHHIISDAWSMGLLIREVATLYAAYSEGRTSPLPELPVQYADYAQWQQEHLRGEALERHLQYWSRQLAGVAPLELPGDRPRPPEQTFRGATLSTDIPADLTAALKRVGEQHRCTLFMTLLAVLNTLLHRYTGQRDIAVGAAVANRSRVELESLIGFFVNTLVLRTDLSGDPTFGKLLDRVRRMTTEAYAHQDVPFEKLVERLQPERDLSRTPLFQVMLVLQNMPAPALSGGDLSMSAIEVEGETARFDITWIITDRPDGLGITIEYNTDLFDAATAERMLGHFRRLLESAAAGANAPLSKLELLTEGERSLLLEGFNDTARSYDLSRPLYRLFERQAEATPDAVALVSGNGRLSYRELNERAERLAHRLRASGVRQESLVGVLAGRSAEMVVALLGIWKAGGAYVPLDPEYPQERLRYMVEDSGVRVLVVREELETLAGELCEGLAQARPEMVKVRVAWDDKEEEGRGRGEGGEVKGVDAGQRSLAYVIYTSGSTGRPKGVAVEHGGLRNLAEAQREVFGLGAGERVMQFSSPSFDASVWEAAMGLAWGACLFVGGRGEGEGGLQGEMRRAGVTAATLPPSLLAVTNPDGLEELRTVIAAGESCSAEIVARWAPGRRFFNAYGPTETTVCASLIQCDASSKRQPTIGRPIANTRVYILDEAMQPVPIGVPGELYVAGVQLARGYLGRPSLTAERFIPDPFSSEPGARLYKTGDLARYLPDGEIEFLGRIDRQVKVRGFRIELGEIEAALSSHPSVRECAVVAREDASGDRQLVAYFVGGDDAAAGELRRHLRERLPEYMVPAAWVRLERLPLTPNGKVDRRALPEPEQSRRESEESYVAPRNVTEQTLARIWSEVLGVERVGVYDNFFDSGGHSLSATRVVASVREAFRVELPLRSLFEEPTIAAMAGRLGASAASAAESGGAEYDLPVITPDPEHRHEPFPLTDVQQAYWIGRSGIFELSNVSAHGYLEFEFVGLELGRLNEALRRLIDRHDMLRSVVLPDGRQQILPHVPPYEIETVDLSGQGPRAVAERIEAVRQRMSHQVLSAEEWPLFEIMAHRLDGQRVRLHVSVDAMIGDALSMQILLAELARLYHEPESRLAPLELSFRDYVLAENALQETALYRRSRDYWLGRVATLPPAPELPLALNPGSLTQPRFARQSSELDAGTWARLKSRATQVGLTPSGLLCAAFAEVLAYWSKSPRFTINLTLFNRLPLHPQVGQVVGDFTSLTLLAVESTQESFAARARRIQEQLWDDLDHRYFSGVRVLRELARAQGGAAKAMLPVVFTSTLTQDLPDGQAGASPVQMEVVHSITQTPQVWLDHQVSERDGVLFFSWDAVEALFPEGLLQDMFAAYCRLLQSLADEEGAWDVAGRQLLPPAQSARRLAVNATEAPEPSELLHALFARQASERPRQMAVISPRRSLTYEELFEESNRLGRRLRQLGARPNRLVAVVMEKGWEQVVAVLGILASGAAYLPVDAALPKERLWYLLEHGEVELAVTQSHVDEGIEWPAGVRRLRVDSDEVLAAEAGPLEPVQRPCDLAYVIYTSGSTGLPKGVMIDHRGAVNTVLDMNRRFGVTAEDRVLALSSLSFDLSVYDIFGLLAAGGTVVMPSPSARRDPAHWARLLTGERVTIWNSVPALMGMLTEHAAAGADELRGSALRLVLLSGDWIPVSLPGRIRDLFAEAEVISLGGATEASIWSILYPVGEVDPAWSSIPYGRPMVNQRFHVLDEALDPRPDWVPGHLYIGGIGLAQGYWRDEAKTRASFFEHPRTGERLYRTGDLGRYLPDGEIEFLGREDFQVKIQGYRIELGEVESALEQHPAVRSAVAAAVGARQGSKRLVAYVVPAKGDEYRDAAAQESEGSPVAEIPWEPLVQAGRRQSLQLPPGIAEARVGDRYQDRLSVAYICSALRGLGVYARPGERHSADDLIEHYGVRPRYRKLIRRWLKTLDAEGLLRLEEGEVFEGPGALPADSHESVWDEIARDEAVKGGALDFLRNVGPQLVPLLRGEVDPLELLFPSGSWSRAESIYQYNPAAHYFNSIAGEITRAAAASPGRRLRILEVGAGTGGTTASLLPVLPPERTSYTFTDVSSFFTNSARKKFAEYRFVDYGLLNIEQAPLEQGYEPHSYDVVVAANVLHATRDLARTLENVRQLLAPGGLLLLLEGTRNAHVHMITLGFLEGWSRFEDERLRDNVPLLSPEQWRERLASAGFVDFASLPDPESASQVFGEHVMLARAPSFDSTDERRAAPRPSEAELRGFLERKLPGHMVPSSFVFLDSLPLSPNGKVDRARLPEPEASGAEGAANYVAPRTGLERTIAAAWQEVLGLDRVGVNDNFFDVGGDSLLMVRVQSKLREAAGLESVSAVEMFQYPTVSSLAEHLAQKTTGHEAFRQSHARAADRKEALRRRGQQPQRRR